MDDPRLNFISQIDLSKSRIKAFEGFILLCGGESSIEASPLRSVRHLIQMELTGGNHGELASRVRLAEDTKDWFDGGVYSDLVTFEEHLAGLSAVVVLVVESPGAIAELGAFSISEPFLDRLLVIVSQEHYEQQSFIRLGPVQKIENSSSDAVLVYDWHDRRVGERPTPNFELLRGDVGEIVSAIQSYTSPSGREHVFKFADPSHAMSLICELCDLFGALSEKDIHDFLQRMGLEIGLDSIRRYLFLLQKCGLIFLKSKGHGRYYYVEEWKSRLSFSYTGGGKFDRQRIKIDTVAYYDMEMKSRAEVVRKIRKSS